MSSFNEFIEHASPKADIETRRVVRSQSLLYHLLERDL
jgi:hypothetical protein